MYSFEQHVEFPNVLSALQGQVLSSSFSAHLEIISKTKEPSFCPDFI